MPATWRFSGRGAGAGPPRATARRRAPLEAGSAALPIRFALGLATVLGVALAVRLVFLAEFSESPWFHYTVTDERINDRIARLLVAGEPGWSGAFYQPPGYPLFLSALYAWTDRSLAEVRLAQLLLGVVNVGLLALVGRRIFGPAVGLVAGLLLALYGPLVFFEGMLLPPVLIVFLNLAFFWLLLRCIERPRWWRALATGTLLGASAATMSLVLPFAAVVVAMGGRAILRRGAGAAAPVRVLVPLGSAFLLGLGGVVGACTLHNWIVAERVVLISDNLGINLYLGSGVDFERKARIGPGDEWAQLAMSPVRAGREGDRNAYFVERALQIIRGDPLGYAASLVRKLFLFAHGHELKRNQEIYPFRQHSTVLAGLLWKAGVAWPFGLLFPFAVLGMAHAVRARNDGATLMLLFCVSHVVFLLPFFVAARYRMNIVPFLLLFAVHGGGVLLRALASRDLRTTGGAALILGVFLALSNWQVGPMSRDFDPILYQVLAKDVAYEGRKDQAHALLAQAERVSPAPDPGESIPQRTSALLVAAGALAWLGYRRVSP